MVGLGPRIGVLPKIDPVHVLVRSDSKKAVDVGVRFLMTYMYLCNSRWYFFSFKCESILIS